MINTSFLVKQERCPSCANNGKDLSKDNLGVYSDGHKYCFACGYTELSNGITKFKNENNLTELEDNKVFLPVDCDIIYPQIALDWVSQYEIDKNTLYKNNVMWSNSTQRLFFPVYDDEGLIAYQGRYFGNDPEKIKKSKWWGKGDLKNIFHFLGDVTKPLVIVEDIISAIKISNITQSMPLFGNHIGVERFKRLFKIIPRGLQCILWLDPDMRKHSVNQSKLGSSMGINMKTIFTDKDPKEYSYIEIMEILK